MVDIASILPTSKTVFLKLPTTSVVRAAVSSYFCGLQDVGKRILGALIFRKSLFSEIEQKPDLYGPFWLSTTAIFMMAMISNALDYFAYSGDSDEIWEGDLKKIASGAVLVLYRDLEAS